MRQNSDEIRLRPGRIRSRGDASSRRFVGQVLHAAQKAGGMAGSRTRPARSSTIGRGRAASVSAGRGHHARTRQVTVKARVVRRGLHAAPLAAHLAYLQRDGVTRGGAPGELFGPEHDAANGREFATRAGDDRHHFRFIVSPEDAARMQDLRAFTRELMATAEHDLGTKLDWVAAEHHNTEHPHVHVLVRGRADDGADLVISRDYIREGLRARAQTLVSLELGPPTELEIRQGLEAQVNADRWTQLDRDLVRRSAGPDGIADLRPNATIGPDPEHHLRLGRLQKLERLGLATPVGPAQWRLDPDLETSLRELGERCDIIKRLHRAMGDRSPSEWVIAAEAGAQPIVGKLVERGLDDELKGSAYAIVDGVDGRLHHLRLKDLDATGDAAPGAVIELRRFADASGRQRAALATRSDLDIVAQTTASGATWLDRRLVDRAPSPLAEKGFGAEVRTALEQRANYLVGEGLAIRRAQRVVLARNLLATLRQRELAATASKLVSETGRPMHDVGEGDEVAGTYRRRITLASGRFVMIDDGLGFSLVPWTPALERQLGQSVSGVMSSTGADWSFGRKRGLGIG